MLRLTAQAPRALHDAAGSRRVEAQATAALAPHTLMQRAGLAVARLALAVAPHARIIWIACGPGNNGGDGAEAALHLHARGKRVVLTRTDSDDPLPADAAAAWQRAHAAGLERSAHPPAQWDLCIDALLGLGAARAPQGQMADWITQANAASAPILAVDLPTGLDADTGARPGVCIRAQHTLSLLTVKPGLFTAHGRDQAGQVWFDDLGVERPDVPSRATLPGTPAGRPRPHDTHKGSQGDVAVIGGAAGMRGAALLAARAALHAGAGRVYVCALDEHADGIDPGQPELMWRQTSQLDLRTMSAVCGCGGADAVRTVLARVLSTARDLVLDADALNAMAADAQFLPLLRARAQRQRATVLTPHPLEAARLLSATTAEVQANRLAAAESLAQQCDAIVVLKGSGTVVAAPDRTTAINPTGNALLATAGTGDVLAGMIGAGLAAGLPAFDAAWQAVHRHGQLADDWPAQEALTAGALAQRVCG